MHHTPRARKPNSTYERTPSRNRSEPGDLLALEATLSKQVRQTENKHEQLKKQYDKLSKNYTELQGEFRKQKATLEITERDLVSAKKMLSM